MSIQTEITRLQGLKASLRTKLVVLGLVQSGADLEDCVAAVDGLENRGAVDGAIDGLTAAEYPVPRGFHNGLGKVALTNDIEQALAAI